MEELRQVPGPLGPLGLETPPSLGVSGADGVLAVLGGVTADGGVTGEGGVTGLGGEAGEGALDDARA